MSDANELPVTGEDITNWYNLTRELAQLKEKEMALRKRIASAFFPHPEEGTNTIHLVDKWQLKLQHTITRTLDEAAFDAHKKDFRKMKLPIDELVIQVPKFNLKPYRALTDEQRNLFDLALIIKDDGAPTLSLVQGKR